MLKKSGYTYIKKKILPLTDKSVYDPSLYSQRLKNVANVLLIGRQRFSSSVRLAALVS